SCDDGCDDGNDCTNDSCDPVLGCVSARTATCSPPTTTTTASSTTSTSTTTLTTPTTLPTTTTRPPESPTTTVPSVCDRPCDDGDPCNGVERCDAASGRCVPGTALDCDDHERCTTDSCVRFQGCSNQPLQGRPSVRCRMDDLVDILNAL